MEPRVSLITIGVADLERSRRFYEALGWRSNSKPEEGVVFFQSGGMVLALWSREELAADSCVEDGGGWGGVTIANNLPSPADVDAFIERARGAGARIGREPAPTSWGGYSAIFIDPDGHPWEVAHNPFWGIDAEGNISLAGPAADGGQAPA
jgi:catechol 2,3-dioxygenase-like lactoylglutathione lyase family enzyme